MELIDSFFSTLNSWVWGPGMLALISITGIYLTLGSRAYSLRNIPSAFSLLWAGRKKGDDKKGDISGFNALMTSLSATIGTGNIAGVATAIALGGPGALFWMWMIALVGMATKYAEAVLAVHYRENNSEGNYVGGPMYYIKNGLGKNWRWLASTFAFFGMLAGFGIGNSTQSNSVADVMANTFAIDERVTGAVLAVIVFLVLIGGIKRIAEFAGKLVPIMASLYIISALVLMVIFADKIPGALSLILEHAFNPVSATGGFAGATVLYAIRFGIARGIFSNEAGLGSAPIAHAAAKTNSPVQQGTIAMLGTFIDTIIVCSMTGIVIVASGAWTTGASGADLTIAAFQAGLPAQGGYIIAVALTIFAFTTIIGWAFYGEKCAEYLFGVKSIPFFRIAWIISIFFGASVELNLAWLIADTLNALMAIPNLIALLLLSPVVFKLTKDYLNDSRNK